MILAAAKFAHGTNYEDFSGLNVQLTFRQRGFYELDHLSIMRGLSDHDINISCIHYPSVFDDNFTDNIYRLSDAYQQNTFVIHPLFDSLQAGCEFFGRHAPALEGRGIVLALENMPGPKGNWKCYVENIAYFSAALPFVKIAYDVTHLPPEVEEKQGIERFLKDVEVIHLSNAVYSGAARRDHLPFDEGERDLQGFLRFIAGKGYEKLVVLEYMPGAAPRLKPDIRKLERLLQ